MKLKVEDCFKLALRVVDVDDQQPARIDSPMPQTLSNILPRPCIAIPWSRVMDRLSRLVEAAAFHTHKPPRVFARNRI